ncbi:membrane-bound lytic murein transglycosylase D [Reichenbachiella faecimaris]|uniref:Membrane-bound lytic murein transglycosylase D n=1 Tax=Reichenbachiella faecimaris TaxID=692418 RepID=A0A1W2GEG3_REIFA|nr:lytic transglycosylase domain-containing protein [Reichenbachiella faecimaris]SMD34981.1 membrane-bound lytic murein transglycosylase D [Reichenbachiella faecimaris]
MIKNLLIILGLIPSFYLFAQKDASLDQYPEASYELMQDRLKCVEGSIPLEFNTRIKSFIDYFTIRDREYTKSVLVNRNVFFPIFEQALAERGMPDELKYLSIVESGLRPNAMSRVGAAGLWQFMPATGRSYGLSQSWYIDERMDPYKATQAACRYLKALYNMFGDWELALAAYNTGPGNVRKAIRRSGYKKTFWEIYNYLPRETRSYVPQFVAMIYTLNYLDEHNFVLDEMEMKYQVDYDTLHVNGYMHLETFANLVNVCVDDLISLNPHVIRGATPDGTLNFPLRVPMDLADDIRMNRRTILDSASKVGKVELEYLARNSPGSTYGRTRQIYRVRSGDVLGTIAQRYHVRVSDLKRWNNLNSNMIRVGQRLNIWTLPHYSSQTRETYVVKNVPKPVPIIAGGTYHLVKSGESLWSISKLYEDLSIEKIKKLNNLTSSNIKPGQKLLINM